MRTRRFHPVPFAVLSLAMAACTGQAGYPPPSSSAAAAPAVDARVLDDSLSPYVNTLLQEGLIPGVAVVVVRRGQPDWVRGFGWADVEARTPVTPSTVFYIASSTKSFTGTLAAVLDARGTIDLDAPLGRYLPELRLNPPLTADSITLRALLTHTSGIRNGPITFRTAYSGDHDDALLVRLLGESQPIERTYRYDNLGYIVAALAMERAAGRDWQDLLKTEVFQPLGMAHTTARVSEAEAGGWPMAAPYITGPNGVERIAMLKRDNTMHAAGGMLTTAEDLARWLHAQLDAGRVGGQQALPADAIREAHTPYVTFDETVYRYRRSGYGLGWNVADYEGERMLHHFGGYEGWRTHVSFLPERGIGVAVLINDSSPIGGMAPDVIATYAYDLLLGRPGVNAKYAEELGRLRENAERARGRIAQDRANRAARPPTPAERKPYFAGTYESPQMGVLDIRLREGGELWATMGNLQARLDPFTRPDALRVEMSPGSGEVVQFYFSSETAPADSVNIGGNVFRRRRG